MKTAIEIQRSSKDIKFDLWQQHVKDFDLESGFAEQRDLRVIGNLLQGFQG